MVFVGFGWFWLVLARFLPGLNWFWLVFARFWLVLAGFGLVLIGFGWFWLVLADGQLKCSLYLVK